MSKIVRYAGNLQAFGSGAQGTERTLFGETSQANDLTSQITNAFLRGWGIVGPSENPSMEDFNAAMYTMSQFIAYQHQMGVPEWDALQEYYSGSICVRNGETYLSLVDSNVGSPPPSVKWTLFLTVKNAIENISGLLKTTNNLSEIKDAGPAAVAQTLLNLGLGDAAHLPQLTGIVGTSRNVKMSIVTTSATATLTADELIVQTALGGLQYKLSSFNKTINLATTGAGGMDSGTVPTTGYVALYVIFNPTTSTSALLAVNATSVLAPEVCGGVMPSGYTASALVSVWRIVASKFIVGEQTGRSISTQTSTAFSITVSTPATTIASISSIVPLNANKISGYINVVIATTGGGNYAEFNLYSSGSSVGRQSAKYGAATVGDMNCNYEVSIANQSVYYSSLSASGSLSATAYITRYEF
ncbi:TPA: hypothetical protein ACPZHP_001405 [Yersinia enterocolitica]